MKKVAIYVRVSTDTQAEKGFSIDHQISQLTDWALSNQWEITKIYNDSGFSGAKLDRPAMKRMIDDCKAKKFNAVLVYKLDRLSRDLRNSLTLIEDIFKKNNVELLSKNEDNDLNTANGMLSFSMYQSFAQYERVMISQRMMSGKIERAKQGKPLATSFDTFGYHYANDTLHIVDIQAEVVKSIFSDYLSGDSVLTIANRLNDEGHIGKKAKWSTSSVRFILDNKTYAGFNKFQGVYYKGNHDPLVSMEIYEKVQEQLFLRQKKAYDKTGNARPFQSKYMLSGLLRCAKCNAVLSLSLGAKRKDGSRYGYYRCSSTIKHNLYSNHREEFCDLPSQKKHELESVVISEIKKIIINKDDIGKKGKKNNDIEKIESLKKSLKKLDTQENKILNLYLDDTITKELLDKKKSEIEKEKKFIESKIEKNSAKKDVSKKDKSDLINSIKKDVSKMNYDEQKKVVRLLIKEVLVSDDTIHIRWNF